MRNLCNSLLLFMLSAIAMLTACAGAAGRGPGQGTIVVNVQPASANLFLGQTQQFQAVVTGTSNTAVAWSVNGIGGGNSSVGTISGSGLFTAPTVMPASATVTITGISVADTAATGSALVTLKDDIVVTISPPSATVPVGTAQVFTATVTASGSPATGVTWSVNGIAGGNATIGTIAATGNASATYTAPAAQPSPPNVTVAAISVADATKTGTAVVTITCTANSISPASANVPLGQPQTFTASLCGSGGGAITWDVNGIAGGNATVGTITGSGADTATYVAPSDLPSANPVTIHATSGTATASATATITSSVTGNISPPSATIAVTKLPLEGAHVVAVDKDTGTVAAGTLGGWSCSASSPPPQFDGAFDIERLAIGHNYLIYAEPLDGLVLPGDFGIALNDLCHAGSASPCTTPAVNTNFNPRIRPSTQ